MPNRQRSKVSSYTRTLLGGDPVAHEARSEIMSDNNDPVVNNNYKNKDCAHVKLSSPFTGKISDQSHFQEYHSCSDAFLILADIFAKERNKVYIPLDFQQDDDFELFTALADLDSTIGTFTAKTAKRLFNPKSPNKGQNAAEAAATLQWGILPFVSDLKSLYNSLQSAYNGHFARSLTMADGKRTTRRFNVKINEGHYHFTGTAILQGRMFTNPSSMPSSAGGNDAFAPLKIALDELGVHPDLRTLWDVIPLSFVLDYIVPVGDTLEALHPRGWFSPEWRFDGTFTVMGDLVIYMESNRKLQHSYECYRRGSAPVTMSSRQSNGFELPESDGLSLTEIANTTLLHKLRNR